MILASSLGRTPWTALSAGSISGTCVVVGPPTVRLTYSSAKKSRHSLETHWLGFSMSIVIFARGHGSGSVDRQCSNSDVSSGAITGSSPSLGRYCIAVAALPLLCCVWDLGGFMCCLDEGAMFVDHGSQILACTDGCSARAGSIFRLSLCSGSKYVTRLFFRRPGWLCACSAACGGSHITNWCIFGAW